MMIHSQMLSCWQDNAIKVKILKAAQTELMKHSLDTFVDNPPSIVQPVLVPNLNRKSTASDAATS
jgi:hypothetical protein